MGEHNASSAKEQFSGRDTSADASWGDRFPHAGYVGHEERMRQCLPRSFCWRFRADGH
jgi:hypothetical protein